MFARLPVAGRVKSRLSAGVGPAAACTFYAACAAHALRTVDSHAATSGGQLSWSLHYSDARDADGVRSWVRDLRLTTCHSVVAQQGDSLGDRLFHAFKWSVAQPENWATVCVVGTDVPDLCGADLQRALLLVPFVPRVTVARLTHVCSTQWPAPHYTRATPFLVPQLTVVSTCLVSAGAA